MARTNSWTPHSYPLQSSHTEQSPRQEAIPDKSAAPRLSKTIRAVSDANRFKPKGRTLIICLDGTGDKFDNDNSNIVHLVSCLKKDDPSQVSYYQSGIGTYDGGGLKNGLSAAFDMAIGSGLGDHIKDAYRFLMQTYREGDKICIFGFSRGAYTARCLAGMLHKVGLLPAHNSAQVPFAYQFYKDDSPEGWKMSAEFKKTFCIDASVYFVGVFDCVASVGFIPRKLPFSSTPTNKTGHFRHAMALDEHRAKFKVSRWQRKDKQGEREDWAAATSTGVSVGRPEPDGVLRRLSHTVNNQDRSQWVTGADGNLPTFSRSDNDRSTNRSKQEETIYEKQVRLAQGTKDTDVLEVWFMGCHADVGGGAVPNEERHMLSRIPLRWMIRQCFLCNTGIIFDTAAMAEVGLDVHTLWPVCNTLPKPVVGPSPKMMEKYETGLLGPISRRSTALDSATEENEDVEKEIQESRFEASEDRLSPTGDWIPEQVEDYFDAMAPLNDQLVIAKGWWVLEVWPIKVRIQRDDSDDWEKKVRMNLGRFRAITEAEPSVHWTVRQRMLDQGYKVRSRFDRNVVWQIVT